MSPCVGLLVEVGRRGLLVLGVLTLGVVVVGPEARVEAVEAVPRERVGLAAAKVEGPLAGHFLAGLTRRNVAGLICAESRTEGDR